MKNWRLNRAQRVVVVIAIGFALYLLGSWVTSLGSHLPYGSATFTNVNSSYLVGGLHPWARFVIWILTIVAWVGVSISLLIDKSMNQRGRVSSQ
jgi:hypothetical protein